jgi:hypothetical protein
MAHELHKSLAAGIFALALAASPDQGHAAQSDLLVTCTFVPQNPACASLYENTQQDSSPAAMAARQAFERYAHYLTPQRTDLTEQDRRYLKDNDIALPFELNQANRAGLHNVINDPSLKDADRRDAAKAFVSYAVRAELYCGLRDCSAAIQETRS